MLFLGTRTFPPTLHWALYDLDRRLVDTALFVDRQVDKAFTIHNAGGSATCCIEPGDAGYNELNKIWRNR